jgi:F0F1-type ATP synthase assembly protein I
MAVDQPDPDRNRQTSVTPGLARYGGMGLELGAAIVGLTLVGYWIDRHFDSHPRGLLVGAVLGIVGGMYNFIREAMRLSRMQNDARTGPPRQHREDDDGHG